MEAQLHRATRAHDECAFKARTRASSALPLHWFGRKCIGHMRLNAQKKSHALTFFLEDIVVGLFDTLDASSHLWVRKYILQDL
jgi:hypothetical protein